MSTTTPPLSGDAHSHALPAIDSTPANNRESIMNEIAGGYSRAYTTVPPIPRSIAHLCLAMMDLGTAQACITKEIQQRTLHLQGDRGLLHNNVNAAIRELELVILRLKNAVPSMEELSTAGSSRERASTEGGN